MLHEQEPHIESVDPGVEKSLFVILKFLLAVKENKRVGELYAFDPENPEASREQLRVSDTGDLQIKQGKNWKLLQLLPSKLRARLRLESESLVILQAFYVEKSNEKPYRPPLKAREAVRSSAHGEREHEFTVPNALNPFREALLASGIPDIKKNPLAQERKDIAVNLAETLKADQDSYRSAGLIAWADNLNTVDWSKLTPGKRKIIEQEISGGAIPIFMPDKTTQLNTTVEDYTKRLKPLWIKDGQPQQVADADWWNYFKDLIAKKAAQLVADVPDRPYLSLQKPTQKPEQRTRDKTVAQQLQEFAKIQKERQEANLAPIHLANPAEYGALQKRATEELQKRCAIRNLAPNQLKPLDSETWTRFINLPLSSDGYVPYGNFYPGDRQLCWSRDGAVSPHPWGGFRLAVGVEF